MPMLCKTQFMSRVWCCQVPRSPAKPKTTLHSRQCARPAIAAWIAGRQQWSKSLLRQLWLCLGLSCAVPLELRCLFALNSSVPRSIGKLLEKHKHGVTYFQQAFEAV